MTDRTVALQWQDRTLEAVSNRYQGSVSLAETVSKIARPTDVAKKCIEDCTEAAELGEWGAESCRNMLQA